MEKILKELFNASNFIEVIPTFEELQDVYLQMEKDRMELVSEINEFKRSEMENALNLPVWKKELRDMEKSIPVFENTIASNPDIRLKDIEDKVHRNTYKAEALRKKLARYTGHRRMKAALLYASYVKMLRAMDSWMERVGEWFETGVLGEGEVEYNGKKYSYKNGG